MRLPASVSTFMVLLVALLGTVLYVDSRDIDTTVRTAEESRLPNTYPENAEAPFLRYPADWQLTTEPSPDVFTLSVEGEDGVVYPLLFQVRANAAPEQSAEETLRATLPSQE